MDKNSLNHSERLTLLSIVVDDFDSAKGKDTQQTEAQQHQESEVSIRKILDEAEHRKHEFWKLIDEHNAVVENLKRIERKDERNVCNVQIKQIRT